MKNFLLPLLTVAILTFTGCQQKQTATEPENPFFSEYTTPFQVPPFDKIDTSHYLPAFIEGIRQQAEEIAAITGNTEAPDFENTILAYDKSGKLLNRVSYVFYNLNGAHTNDQMQEIARKISPLMSKHQDDISMNPELFGRIKKVYEKRHDSGLDDQQIRVVEKYYRDFERQGANLPAGQQETLRKINEELAMLQVKFGENQLAEINKNFGSTTNPVGN